MSVSLTISETLDGAALSDSLAGGGTGVDLGSVTPASYAPVIDRSLNTGKQDLYISHDAVVDEITNLKIHIGQFGVLTGFTYGGADSAANDYTNIKALGSASGSSKNNNDGLSAGIWADFDSDVTSTNQFDYATNGKGQGGNDSVVIFGKSNEGIDLASAFIVKAAAMVYENSGEQQASSPVDGKVGKAGDTVLGDSAHTKVRVYLPETHADGGIYQLEYIFSYTYTA